MRDIFFTKVNKYDLKEGGKKLLLEVEVDKGLTLYLLHLSLSKRARIKQLKEVSTIVNQNKGPKLVLGDFNTSEESEIKSFIGDTGLKIAKHKHGTFPSWKPKKCLDYVLFSKEVLIKSVVVPKIMLSDHLPIIVDFEVLR